MLKLTTTQRDAFLDSAAIAATTRGTAGPAFSITKIPFFSRMYWWFMGLVYLYRKEMEDTNNPTA